MKNEINIFIRILFVVLISSFIGTLMLLCVWQINSDTIINNVKRSATIMYEEGAYPVLSDSYTSELDNFTDSIMLLEAADTSDDSLVNRALLSYRQSYKDSDPHQTIVNKYINNNPDSFTISYPRYWHGYLIFVKPLLLISSYSGIRKINALGQLMMVLLMMYAMYKNDLKKHIIPYILVILMLCPLALYRSIQFSTCFYIFNFVSILVILLNRKNQDKYNWLIFTLSGIITSYFDFLTYPVTTFGIPFVFYFLVSNKDSKDKLINLIKYGIYWCLGYVLMWANKWIITSLFTDYNAIEDAIGKIMVRTSRTDFSVLQTLSDNWNSFIKTPVIYLVIAYIAYAVIMIIKNHKAVNKDRIAGFILIMVICLIPIVWYVFATNHSYIHSWFTNKALSVSFFAFLSYLTMLI